MRAIGVIPARWGATRFEGKVIANLLGKPVIQQTGGIGAGVGTDGAGAAVYVQVSRTTPLTKTSGGAR